MSASDQKYTEFWKYLHYHFAFDWMTLTQDLKAIKISQRKDFTTKRVRESKCRRTETVDKDILLTYRFSDRKFSQPFIIASDLPQEQGIRNNSAGSLFHKLLTNVMWMKSASKTVSCNEIHRSLLRLPWLYRFIW